MTVKIFCCYAHEDELLLNKLKSHLKPLQRQELIDVWHDRNISAGTEWEREVNEQLNTANIILLLVSPDFMASDYCYSIEVKRALERHERKEARVIPVILRHVYWKETPFGKLQALPTDATPVMDRSWHTVDEGFVSIVEGIRIAIGEMAKNRAIGKPILKQPSVSPEKSLNGFAKQKVQRNQPQTHTLPSPRLQGSTSPRQNESPVEQMQGKSQLSTLPKRSLGKRLLSLLGIIVGFGLTAFGLGLFIYTLYFGLSDSSGIRDPLVYAASGHGYYDPVTFATAGLSTLLGIFIFCRSAPAIVGKYIGYFFLLSGALLALFSYFISDKSTFYIAIGSTIIFISIVFIFGTWTRRW